MHKKTYDTMTKQVYVNKDMTIGEAIQKYPESTDIMLNHGLHCIGCHVNPFETIEMGAKGHGISDEVIDKMLMEINARISEYAKNIKAKPNDTMVVLTDMAVSKTKELLKKEKKDKSFGLRIAITEGGCAGSSYEFSFENKKRENDELIQKNGLKVFIDKESFVKMSGSTIDFIESLHGAGFKVKNPNAHTSCGCGNSFG